MTRLPLKLQRLGFLLGLMVACSDGPQGPGPTTPAPPRIEPASRTVEPAPEVAHSTAPAPPQATGEIGGPEAAEGGEATSQVVRTRTAADNPPPPAPSSGSGAPPPDNPGNGSGGEEEEEEEKKEGEGEGEEEEEEPGPRQTVPCDRVGSADISARATSDTTVDLTWRFSTEPECEQFVTFSISRDGTNITPDSTRSHKDTGRTANRGYSYTVEATSSEGSFSSTTTVTTWQVAPAGFRVVLLSESDPDYSTALRLTWTAASTSASYKARRKTGRKGIYGAAFDISSSGSQKNAGLTTNIEYCYEIYRSDTTPRSAWTEADCERPVDPPLDTPTGLTVNAENQRITVDWDDVTGATGYKVWRREGNGSFGSSTHATPRGSGFSETAPRAGTKYCYKVSATGGRPDSMETAEECATTAPPAPTGVGASARSMSVIRITWNAADGATSYMVRRKDTGSTRTDNRSPYDWSGLSAGIEYCFDVKATNAGGSSAWSSEACERTTVPTPRPPPPTGVGASALSTSAIQISWNEPGGADSYLVRRKDSGSTRTDSRSPYDWSGLEPDTEYCFDVKARNAAGSSDWSSEDCATTPAPDGLDTPQNVTASVSGSTVTVRWDSVTDAARYKIWRGEGRDTDPTEELATPRRSPYTDNASLEAGTEYCYAVSATEGSRESMRSSEACATTAPPTPTGVNADEKSATEIRITWSAAPGATSYKVRIDGDDNDTETVIGTDHDWDDLTPNTRYCFDVQATNAAGTSDWSSPSACDTTDVVVTPVVPAPENVQGSARSSSEIRITWDAVTVATGYTVRRDGDDSDTRTANGSPFDWSGLDPGTRYCFDVMATTSTVPSDWSEEACVATTLDPPGSFTSDGATTTSVSLSWTEAAGADGYEVRHKRMDLSNWGSWVATDSATGHTVMVLQAGIWYDFEVWSSKGTIRSSAVSHSARTEAATPGPDRPEDLAAASAAVSSMDLSWTGVAGADSYELQRKVGESGSFAPGTEFDAGSGTSHVDRTVSLGTTYCYRARTVDGGQRSDWTEAVCASPGVPGTFQAAAASPTAVDLSWDSVTGAGSYEVRHRVARGAWENWSDVSSATSHRVSGLVSVTEYEFEVRTAVGTAKSLAASDGAETPEPGDPDPPALFDAQAASDTAINLGWDAVSGADRYEFVRKEGAGSYPPDADAVDVGDVTQYADMGLSASTEYCYRVRTVEGTRHSAWTSDQCATTDTGSVVPENLRVSAVSSSVLELTWDEVDGATGYRLRRRLETASIWQDENIVPDSDTLHRDTGLLANTQYCYGARALGVGDVPMWSADVCGWTKRPAPTGLRLTRLSRTSATVAWDALAGADSYVLYTGGRTIPVSGTSGQVGELARRRPHRFAVAGVFQGQETDRSGLLTVTLADPVSPATLAAEAEATQVSLSWPAGSGAGSWSGPDGAGGNELTYRVDRRSPARQGDFAVVAEGLSELSYVDGGLAPDTEYEYRVWTTVEIPGFTLRGRSEPTRTVRTRDSGPENLEAQAASSVSVALSWDAAPGAGGYEFRWSPDGAAWSAPLSAGSGTTHDHTGLNPETPYHYQVRVAPTTAAPDPPWSEADDTATGKLETPAGLAVDAMTSASVTLRWDGVPAAASYELERTAAGGMPDEIAVSGTSHEDMGLMTKTGYSYRVRSVLMRGTTTFRSEWSVAVPAMTGAGKVQNLQASATSSVSMGLSWDAITGAASYEFWWSLDGAAWSDPLSAGSGTRYDHPGLDPETPYHYQVRVTAMAGMDDPPWSDAVQERTRKLETPTGLAVDAVTSGSVTLTWDAVATAESYELERMVVSSKRTTTIRGVASGYRDEEGVTPDTEYEYRVRSVRTRGTTRWESALSASEAATTPAVTPPDNLAAQAASSVSVDLSWDTVTGADRYEFRWRLRGEEWDDTAVVDAGAATRATHAGRDPETTYEYQVRALAGTLMSAWSEPEQAATTPKLETPTGLAADATSSSVTLTWDAVAAAESYELVRMAVSSKRTTTIRGVASGYRDEEGVAPDTEYEYRVRSVRTRGATRWESALSASEAVTTPALTPVTPPPDVPANLEAEAASSVSVDLSWDTVTGADRYEFRWRLRGAEWDDTAVVDAGAATRATHAGRDPETTYEYQVRAVAGTLMSAWSEPEQAATTRKLETPTGLAADATSSAVTLTWDAVAAAESYELVRMAVSSKRTTTIRGVTSGYRDEEGVAPDTEYEYRVRSVRTRGTTRWESALSASEAVTTLAVTPVTPPPDVPANLEAEAASAVSVDLSWDTVTGADRYEFRWRLRGEEWDDQAVVDAGAATQVTQAGRDPETTYEYQVRAVAGTLMSAWSEPEQAATTPKLETPTGLAADATSSSVTLTWDAVAAAESYELERMAVSSKRTTTIRGVTSGYRDEEGVAPDTEYEYRVRSVRTRGTTRWESALSAPEAVTTPAVTPVTPPPDVPANLEAEAASSVSVDLSWDAVTGADRYEFRWRLRGEEWDDTAVVNAGAATRATHAGRDPETTYEYQVRAVAGTLMSAWSGTEDVTTPAVTPPPVATPLAAPQNLTAEATSAFSVSLSWDAVTGAESYHVRRREPISQTTTEFLWISGTSYEDGDLSPETTYTYDVGSVAGSTGPVWSAPLNESTPEFAGPATFAAQVLGPDSVEVSWDAVPGDGVQYKVRHRVSGTRPWTTHDFTASPGTVSSLKPLTVYDFRIVATRRSSSGTVHRTAPVNREVTTLAPDPPRLQVDETAADAVELSWTSVTGATGYELQRRSPAGTGTWGTVYGPDSGTSYRDEAVSAATEYEYQVRAVISDRGETDWSALSVTTDP